jgi:hypothetical protein
VPGKVDYPHSTFAKPPAELVLAYSFAGEVISAIEAISADVAHSLDEIGGSAVAVGLHTEVAATNGAPYVVQCFFPIDCALGFAKACTAEERPGNIQDPAATAACLAAGTLLYIQANLGTAELKDVSRAQVTTLNRDSIYQRRVGPAARVAEIQQAAVRRSHFQQNMASGDVWIGQAQIGVGRATYNQARRALETINGTSLGSAQNRQSQDRIQSILLSHAHATTMTTAVAKTPKPCYAN